MAVVKVEINERVAQTAKWVALLCGLGVISIGLYVLMAIIGNRPVTTTTVTPTVVIKFNAGLGFILIGGSLWTLLTAPRYRRVGQALATAALLLGALTLSQYIFHIDLGIDQLFWRDSVTNGAMPGRMTAITATTFVLAGIALLLLPYPRAIPIAQAAAVGGFWTTFVGLQIVLFSGITGEAIDPVIAISPLTAAACGIFSIGVLLARADVMPMRLVLADDAGGLLLRLFGLAAVILPVLASLVEHIGLAGGWLNQTIGAAIHITLMSAGLMAMLWFAAAHLSNIDAKRRESERRLQRSNEELEDRVSERTATLEQMVDLLTAENRERQTIEGELGKERNLLRTLIDTLPDYIFIKNTEREFILSNLAHARAAGLDPQTLIGTRAQDSFPPELAAQFEEDDLKVLQDGQSLINVERASVDGDGNLTTMLTTKVPLRAENGSIIGLIGVSRDIRDRQEALKKQMQLEIERGRVAWLEQLIRDLSHDQRTPVTIMRSSLYLLQKTEDDVKRAEYVQRIERQLLHLEQSGENMESLARLELGSGSLRLAACNISAIVPDVVTSSAAAIDQKQHTLTLQLADDLPPVLADRAELMRAIKHLLNNAIYYTDAGGSLSIATRQEGERVALDVRDTGIGISQHDLPYVFNAFYRADKARGLDTGGSGLGLTIVKRVVELLGGEVRIESELGKGTCVTLLLPTIPEAMRDKMTQRTFA